MPPPFGSLQSVTDKLKDKLEADEKEKVEKVEKVEKAVQMTHIIRRLMRPGGSGRNASR